MGLFNFWSYTNTKVAPTSIYDFKIQALHSSEAIDFADFKGKKILMVNVASKCGFTPQYKGLEKLNEDFGDNLVVIGFPCNQFLFQESGSEEKIEAFCQKNYGVSFPMTTKVKVKGRGKHPIYKWLTTKDLNGLDDFKVSWNFNKFLIDENGKLVGHFGAKVRPYDEAILKHLK